MEPCTVSTPTSALGEVASVDISLKISYKFGLGVEKVYFYLVPSSLSSNSNSIFLVLLYSLS